MIATALACASLLLGASPVAASCAGPTWRTETGTVRRGATLTVIGEHWGTQCYDTGLPAGAHGILGDPRTDLTLTLVQDERSVQVAHGDAGANYFWTVDVPIPTDFAPGPATLVISSWAPFGGNPRMTLQISDAPPRPEGRATADIEPTPFGPAAAMRNDAPADDDGPSRTGVVVVAIGVAVVAVALFVARTVRRTGARGGT